MLDSQREREREGGRIHTKREREFMCILFRVSRHVDLYPTLPQLPETLQRLSLRMCYRLPQKKKIDFTSVFLVVLKDQICRCKEIKNNKIQ